MRRWLSNPRNIDFDKLGAEMVKQATIGLAIFYILKFIRYFL